MTLVEEWFERMGGKEFPKETNQRVENYFKEMKIKRGIEFKPYFLSGHDRYNNSYLTDPERFDSLEKE